MGNCIYFFRWQGKWRASDDYDFIISELRAAIKKFNDEHSPDREYSVNTRQKWLGKDLICAAAVDRDDDRHNVYVYQVEVEG